MEISFRAYIIYYNSSLQTLEERPRAKKNDFLKCQQDGISDPLKDWT